MKSSLVFLHISLIKGIGPQAVKKLQEHKSNDSKWSDLYLYTVSDFISLFYLSKSVAELLCSGLKDTKLLDQELDLIKKYSINWTTIISDDYPVLLKSIYAPPTILYWKGQHLFSEENLIACVGSRKANFYGQKVVDSLVSGLVQNSWIIVSGGALGIDSMAHNQTVRSGGQTIVVLGSGLLRPYPASNKKLFENVLASGGALVSSFPLTMQATPGNFPARNRIIAGLSKGCLVIQAAEKSGARITAQFALEQGREVFAVPGSIYDDISMGCHRLLQEGARLVSSVDDILSEFGQKVCSVKRERKTVISSFKQVNISVRPTRPTVKTKSSCPKDSILSVAVKGISFDELADIVTIESDKLSDLLFDLQMDGKIEQDFSGLWRSLSK